MGEAEEEEHPVDALPAERVGHGWPTQALQTTQDALAPQGKSSAQGRVHSALAKSCRRSSRTHLPVEDHS
ncbi:hypothetical protein BEI_1432 [Halomonas beimenensis]|uniref:Uncharacterized protein n=1 Tax=Halomonas beimenensis TaxID=475662 RepID=A0A291P6E1_9GAMM|nr:hypothetical protein BEI_1432 [Halomonas beimenensis]